MIVVWRRQAREEFEAAIDYIFKDSPAGARKVRERILTAVSLLEMWPELGRPGRAGLRELVVAKTKYVVLYRYAPDRVTVVRVLHGMRKR